MAHLQHTIHHQHLEVEFKDRREGMGLQDQLATIYKEKILPLFEAVLNENDVKEYIIQLDGISIDAGVLSSKNWEQELVECSVQQFKKILQQKLISPWPRRKVNDEEAPATPKVEGVQWTTDALFWYRELVTFLETGSLPLANGQHSIQDTERLLLQKTAAWQTTVHEGSLLRLLLTDVQVFERLMRQCTDSFIEAIIRWLTGETLLEESIQFPLQSISDPYVKKTILYSLALLQTARKKQLVATPAFINMFRKVISNSRLEDAVADQLVAEVMPQAGPVIPGEDKPVNSEPQKVSATWHIDNAGLVILHPFLPALFARLGYLDQQQWVGREVQQRAILLCEYLVKGQQEIPEFNLPLNKLLCGYPLTETLDNKLEPTPGEKEQAESLLKAVIEHWDKLKNTSIAGLQGSFLQRPGKLTRTENGWRLQVEQKAYDMLLQTLPWSIGMIKTPWMPDILITDWT